MEELDVASSDAIKDQGSQFTGYAVSVNSLTTIQHAYKHIRLLHPGGDHVSIAFRITHHTGSHDDGKYGAGLKLLKFLESSGAKCVTILMVRYYSGVLLGPKRFVHMEKVTKDALVNLVHMMDVARQNEHVNES